MKDTIIKGDGTSRTLRAASTMPTSYSKFREDALAGKLNVDLLVNAAGLQVSGTPLNQANLLTDETAQALGLASADPTVNEAIAKLQENVTATGTGANSYTDGKITEVNQTITQVEEGTKRKTFTGISVPASGWSSSKPYTQTVTVSGMVATGFPWPVLETYSKDARTSFGKITRMETRAGSVVFIADEEKPTVSLTIRIEVIA